MPYMLLLVAPLALPTIIGPFVINVYQQTKCFFLILAFGFGWCDPVTLQQDCLVQSHSLPARLASCLAALSVNTAHNAFGDSTEQGSTHPVLESHSVSWLSVCCSINVIKLLIG